MKYFTGFFLMYLISFNVVFCSAQSNLNTDSFEFCNGIEIKMNNSNVDKNEFLKILKTFDVERFRPFYVDFDMEFNNGIIVKLIAAETLEKNGCIVIKRNEYPISEFLKNNIKCFQLNKNSILAIYKLSKN